MGLWIKLGFRLRITIKIRFFLGLGFLFCAMYSIRVDFSIYVGPPKCYVWEGYNAYMNKWGRVVF